MVLYLEDESQPTIIKEIIGQIDRLDANGQLVEARARPAADPDCPAVPDHRRPPSPYTGRAAVARHIWRMSGLRGRVRSWCEGRPSKTAPRRIFSIR